MNSREEFNAVWSRFADFEFQPAVTPGVLCSYAQKFAEWANELLRDTASANVVSVNQAKVLLLDKYFEWHTFVPKNHRRRLDTQGHTCIYQVFKQTYERLKVVELSLTPPLLFLPSPPPAPPPPPQIAGIFLGEDE